MTDTGPLSSVQPLSSVKDVIKIQDNILWSCRKKNVRKGPQMKIRSITSQPSRQQSSLCVSLKEHFVILFLSKCLSLAISQNLFNSHFAIYSYCYCYKRIFDSAVHAAVCILYFELWLPITMRSCSDIQYYTPHKYDQPSHFHTDTKCKYSPKESFSDPSPDTAD